MDSYTLIWIKDERSPVRRFQLPRHWINRAAIAAGVLAVIGLGLTWDYWRLRADNVELSGLRVEAAEQREQIAAFRMRLDKVNAELDRVLELERKVRIIANLPGSAAVGGEGVTELVPTGSDEPQMPAGVPVGLPDTLDGEPVGPEGEPLGMGGPEEGEEMIPGLSTPGARTLIAMGDQAEVLGESAAIRMESLEAMIDQLEKKRVRLESMPSIWPARGWLTSRFGPRTSPFTGRTQLHAGIDIAGAAGTKVYAPGHARVAYVGRKGPLGNTVVLDHGFGVRTVYGHNEKILVKAGQQVSRGDAISLMGSTGRSTGPHLHYVVEVNGKPRNPLDYIFD